MDDLRISSTDGEHLILESQDGNRFRLLIDDSLRSSVRNTALARTSEIKLSPREIQTAIRSGETVEQLLKRSGDPQDYIEKFAQPVLDELTHVLSSALAVRISVAGDRYSDVSQTEFGEIIGSRLHASGVTEFSWSTFKDENQSWRILVNYRLNANDQVGIWSFDVKRFLLSPENDNAIALSTQNQLTAPAKLKPVDEPSITDTAALPETQQMDAVIPIGRVSERAQFEKPAVDEKISESKDLLDALKKKREERAAETLATQNIEVVSAQETQSETTPEIPEPTPAPVRRSGRPSIPSFDEIVQGTKSDDE
jgi:hypothetical protein